MKKLSIMFAILMLCMGGQAFAQTNLSQEELDQMLAPIALYPDSLLSQLLMASTYPEDVAEAVRWSKANPSQQGDAAVQAVAAQPWDPSVKSLVAFPQLIQQMGERPDNVRKIGDAFLAQPQEVMDSVQRLRAAAKAAGNLDDTEQQRVISEQTVVGGSQTTIIKIEPADPQIVYVPTYDTRVVYGSWWYPAYPPVYWPPPPGYRFGAALTSGIAFGLGIAIVDSLWGNCDWRRGDININVNKFNNINVNKRLDINSRQVSWRNDAKLRLDSDRSRQRNRDRVSTGAGDRSKLEDFRGRDYQRERDRTQARQALQDRGIDMNKARDQLRAESRDPTRASTALKGRDIDRSKARDRVAADSRTRDRAALQQRDLSATRNSMQQRSQTRNNAFAGSRDAGMTHRQVDRGNRSLNSMQRSSGGGSRLRRVR